MNDESQLKTVADVLTPNPEAVFRKEEDGAFLFDPQSGNLKYINGSGVRIYELCAAGKTPSQIVAILTAAYPDTEGGVIAADTVSFLKELTALGFLRTKGG